MGCEESAMQLSATRKNSDAASNSWNSSCKRPITHTRRRSFACPMSRMNRPASCALGPLVFFIFMLECNDTPYTPRFSYVGGAALRWFDYMAQAQAWEALSRGWDRIGWDGLG